MQYRRLGNSGLKVAEIGLGCNNFGMRADEQTSIRVIESALDIGINLLDTAESYNQGRSEEIVGRAVKGRRSRVIIATKFGHPRTIASDQQPGSRDYIMKAVEGSLRRLNTDYIDLYYFHHPDPATPILETLRTLDDLVRTGSIRYIACSNFHSWQLCEAMWTSRSSALTPFVAVQSRYNLLDREIERELVPCCQAYGVGVVPWGPLAAGFLTGKYRRGQEVPANLRLAKPPSIYTDVLTDTNFDRLARLQNFASESGHTAGELAIAWLLSRPWLGSVIAGAMSPEQVSANVAAAAWQLTPDDCRHVESIP